MTSNDAFNARLDRLKAEATGQSPARPKPSLPEVLPHQLKGSEFGPRQMILPVLSLSILAVGAFAFANVLASDTNSSFDVEAAITMNLSDQDRATLGTDPVIENELKKRNIADPGLARAILSN